MIRRLFQQRKSSRRKYWIRSFLRSADICSIEDRGFDARILSSQDSSKPTSLLTTTVAIEGMTCGACTSAIESGFDDLDGLASFNISLPAERAVIVHDPLKIPTEKIIEM